VTSTTASPTQKRVVVRTVRTDPEQDERFTRAAESVRYTWSGAIRRAMDMFTEAVEREQANG